jgi:porin
MKLLVSILILSIAGAVVCAEPVQAVEADSRPGMRESLAQSGIDAALSLTNIYQLNAKGGTSTHRRQGRWTGSYDVELNFDLARLAGIDGGSVYVLAEGTWSRQDIDGTSVGSAFGVNGDFAPREAFNVIELWYQQALWDDTLQIRIGKLDMTGGFECSGCPVSFDGNLYANDENTQFLNAALVNNPTIPFPDYGLGAIVYWNPADDWYLSVGAADAQADKRETGLKTAFYGEDYWIYMAETGITPRLGSARGELQGAYRVGVWYDPQLKAHSDSVSSHRDDTGVYVSCDQRLTRENGDFGDDQGLGAFFRYGYAPSRSNDLTQFYSFGVQYQGLLEGRDDDVLGVGYAHGVFSDGADATYTEDYESVLEAYYSAQVSERITLSPSVQYVTNPGDQAMTGDAVVVGLRAVVVF